jgi:hypothetical protein
MTPLQAQLQLAQRMINLGIDETVVAQALTKVLTDIYGVLEEEPKRMVCQNTFVPDIQFNDEAKWYEKYNGFMTEQP